MMKTKQKKTTENTKQSYTEINKLGKQQEPNMVRRDTGRTFPTLTRSFQNSFLI